MTTDRTPEQRFFMTLKQRGGVATSADAQRAGLSPRRLALLIEIGAVVPVRRGIYASTAMKIDFFRACNIASRATSGGAISHGSALGLILGKDWRPQPRGNGRFPVDVITPNGSHRRPELSAVNIELTLHQSRNLASADQVDHFGIPTTSPARTLFDVADAEVTGPHGLGLDLAMGEMLATERVKATQLAHLAGGRLRRHGGAEQLRRALEKAHEIGISRTQSFYERLFLLLIATAKLPMPAVQLDVYGPRNGFIRRADFAWLEQRVNVEIDSRRWHTLTADVAHDTAADRRMRAAGWIVIHISTVDIDQRPDRVIAVLHRALGTSAIS